MEVVKEIPKAVGWSSEQFEDMIVRGLCAVYEEKFVDKAAEDRAKIMGVSSEELEHIKALGPYFPNEDKEWPEAWYGSIPPHTGLLSAIMAGCLTEQHEDEAKEKGLMSGYCDIDYVERVRHLPPELRRFGPGQPYKLISYMATNNGLEVLKSFVTVNKEGIVFPTCWAKDTNDYAMDNYVGMMAATAAKAALTINVWRDRLSYWNVNAYEDEARCVFGVTPEHIKSLFYARDLPLSATGRRRPLLHWVEAHRRRLRNGTDVEVKEHLRGIRKFEMHGTGFEITNP